MSYLGEVSFGKYKLGELGKVSFDIRQKLIENAKMVNLASFRKAVACGQTVLPDRSIVN